MTDESRLPEGLNDDDTAWLVCMPVKDAIIPGQRKDTCSDCGEEVWVSEKSEYLVALYGDRMKVLCVQCALVASALQDDAEWREF